jgi:serine protease Do
VPENFNPEHSYGLIIWLHPTGQEREDSVLDRFRGICDERGLILVGPPASKEGWNPSDIAYLMAVISKLAQDYNVNPARMVLFGEGVGGRLAVFFGQQVPGAFGGMVALGTPVGIKSPDAEIRTPLFVAAFADDPQSRKIERSLAPLREQKYPLLFRSLPGAGEDGPTEELARELGRWIDTLDGF